MLEQFSRWFTHQSIEMRSIPEEAPRQAFHTVVDDLLGYFESGNAVWMIDNDNAAVRIRDMEVDKKSGIAFLLLTYADKNIANPAFSNLETGDLRVEEKLEGEGVAVSAHVAIDLRDRAKTPFVNNVILEDVPGLGRTKIEPFLTYAFRKSSRLESDDGDGGILRFRPAVSMSGRMGETLKNDLSAGKLSFVELIKFHEDGDGLDTEPSLQVDKAILRLRVTEEVGGRNAISLLNNLLPKAKLAGYTDIKVSWNHEAGKAKSKEFGTAREDAGDVLTLKTDKITVEIPLSQCEENLRKDIVNHLRAGILAARQSDAEA